MTISADTISDSDGKGNALAPVPEVPGIDPFVAAKPDEPAAPRGLGARLLDYSAHAAMIVGLIGFAWTVGDHVVHRPVASADTSTKVALSNPPAPAADPMTELRERNRELAGSVQALQARLDALQASVGDQGKVAAQVRVLQAGLDNVKTSLGTVRGEQTAALTRLDGKIDRLAQQPTSKIQGLVDRLGKLEHSSVDAAPTASLPRAADRTVEAKLSDPKPVDAKSVDARTIDAKPDARTIEAKPVPRPSELKGADKGAEDPAKPQVLAAWVVRDVYQGVALIEGRRGTLEVVPGVSIPGAGVVKSIDRHGGGWTVTTTKGAIAYAAPARDYRRADRDSYPGDRYRYDF